MSEKCPGCGRETTGFTLCCGAPRYWCGSQWIRDGEGKKYLERSNACYRNQNEELRIQLAAKEAEIKRLKAIVDKLPKTADKEKK